MPHSFSSSIDRLIRSLVACALIIGLNHIPGTAVSVPPERSQPSIQAGPPLSTLFRSAATRAASTTFDSPIASPDSTSKPTATTDLAIAPSLISVSVAISQTGGYLASADKRIQLFVPPGLFQTPTRVSITPRVVNKTTDPQGMILRFDLDALDLGANTQVSEFEQPITLTVDLSGLIDKTQLKSYEHLALFHETNNPVAPWSEIVNPVEIHPYVFQTHLSHFSGAGAGSSGDAPAGWQLKYNPPVVSLFSGAATYNYPIQVPAGLHGLQPSVELAYSTRSMDGLLDTSREDADGLPLGWSMDMASINRDGTELQYCGSSCGNPAEFLNLYPHFSLAINGTNYDLIPTVAGANSGQYVVQGAPNLYVWRDNKFSDPTGYSTTPNLSKEYWVVKIADGTTYRFGYKPDSEQNYTINPAHYLSCKENGYCGEVYGTAPSRWRADLITDTLGNQMTISYTQRPTNDDFGSDILTTYHTQPSEIRYNYVNGQATARIVFANTGGVQNWFNRIDIYNAGLLNRIREYQLGWSGDLATILAITQTNSTSSQWLPPTTFSYITLDHYHGYMVPYINRIDNGYSGATEFSYASDARVVTGWGQSYVVTETRSYDGLSSTPAKNQYTYGTRCYDQTNANFVNCAGAYPDLYGPLVGHDVVTHTLLDFNGSTVLSRDIHTFNIDDNNSPFRGHELSAAQYDGSGNLLTTNQSALAKIPLTGGANFVYVNEADATTYSGGNTLTKRTDYTYDTYGNQAAQYDYGAEERLVNAGFEQSITSPGWITFWSPTPASIATGISFAGQNSLQLQGATTGGVYQDVSGLISGTTYLIRAWVKATAGATGMFELWAHDTTGAHPATSPSATPTTSWSQVTLPYTANATRAVRIHLYYNQTGSGTIYVDEVALAKASDVGDERSRYHDYYPNTTTWIVGRISRDSVYGTIHPNDDNLSYLKQRTRYRYDRQCFNQSPSLGLLTDQDQWTGISASSPCDDPAFLTTRYAYDPWGNPTVVTDTRGFTSTTRYDPTYHMYPITVTNALNQSLRTNYDLAMGLPVTVTDANGLITTYAYDSFGRLTDVNKPGDAIGDASTSYMYLDNNLPFEINEYHKRQSGQVAVRHFYDGLGREIQTHAAISVPLSGYATLQDIVVSRAYDPRGLVISQTMPYAVPRWTGGNAYTTANMAAAPKTLTQYDALGRPALITATDGTTTTHLYSLDVPDSRFTATNLWLEIAIDANGHSKHYVKDAYGQLIVVRELTGTVAPRPLYAQTFYDYDTLGHLTVVTDALQNTTVITYNALGQKIEMLDPDMGHWQYQYDPAGNLITQTDALTHSLVFRYDALNRLTQKWYSDTLAITRVATYTYDTGPYAIGKRTALYDPSGSEGWTYDSRGRVITDSKTINNAGTFNTVYGYDSLDRVLTTTYPTGEVVTQTYNAMGTLENLRSISQAQSFNQWYASNLDYNANGSVALMQLNSSIGITYTYYPLNFRLKNIQANSLLNLNYAYDPVGNIARITDTTNSSQVISFGYDFLDRLTSASTSAVGNGQYNENYDYNQIGNLINKAGVTQWYSDTQHDHAITHLNGSQKFWYDANGNMITRTEGSTVFVQQWNYENRLTSVISGSQVTQFVYDGDGNRVKKIDPNGQPTIYIGAIYEKNLSTTITTTYYFAGSSRIAERQGGVLYYLVGDHLGSTALTLDQNGSWFGEIKYRPYGETRYISGNIPTDRRFTGQRSEEGNLGSIYDFNARMYSPYLNRWIQPDTIVPDPSNPQSLNRYSYGLNNPVKYTDPSGHFTCDGAKNCQEVIERWLKILKDQGGELGAELEKFFRDADTTTSCFLTCVKYFDQLHIKIDSNLNGGLLTDANAKTINIAADLFTRGLNGQGADPQILAGAFGHEIQHLRQGSTALPSTHAEMEAYELQYQLYSSMGDIIGQSQDSLVLNTVAVHDIWGQSDPDLEKNPLIKYSPAFPKGIFGLYKLTDVSGFLRYQGLVLSTKLSLAFPGVSWGYKYDFTP